MRHIYIYIIRQLGDGWHELGNWETGGWDVRRLYFTVYSFIHSEFWFRNIYYQKNNFM